MSTFIHVATSWVFWAGAVFGFVLTRGYQHLRCRWLDRHEPNKDGTRHHVPRISKVWLGGLVAVMILGYVLVQAQQTHDETIVLAEKTKRCTSDLIVAIKRRGDISDTRDRLSEEQRGLLGQAQDATSTWIGRLINPPGEIGVMDLDDPRRQQYGIDVTRVYVERMSGLRSRIAEINVEQDRLGQERIRTPLPDPRCD